MTKTHSFTARGGRNHVVNFHFFAGDDHPIDQQFHKLPFLGKGRLGQPFTDPLTKRFHRLSHPGQFHLLVGRGRFLPLGWLIAFLSKKPSGF